MALVFVCLFWCSAIEDLLLMPTKLYQLAYRRNCIYSHPDFPRRVQPQDQHRRWRPCHRLGRQYQHDWTHLDDSARPGFWRRDFPLEFSKGYLSNCIWCPYVPYLYIRREAHCEIPFNPLKYIQESLKYGMLVGRTHTWLCKSRSWSGRQDISDWVPRFSLLGSTICRFISNRPKLHLLFIPAYSVYHWWSARH